MRIEKTIDGAEACIKLIGRIDTTTVSVMEEAVKECTEVATSLVFDCEELEYVSSVGLRVFLKAQKAMNARGEMRLLKVNDAVMEVFDITGFSDVLTIE